jgi:transposase-like protein/DNA-directed RNA polymerase subunit RPC12/RpoP
MLSFGDKKMIQTDLSSFSYKKGSLVPWCKRCEAQHFYKDGKNDQGIQRYKCRQCGFRFVWTSDLPRRNFFSSIMSFAVEIYTSPRMAASLRGVVKILKKVFSISVSHQTIRQWVLDSKKTISRREIAISTTWHADETYIKIKGIGHWLWIVRCRETGQVLSWHISEGRFFKDAKKLMKDALSVAGTKPKEIITDGLYQYAAAIYKVMGWNWREHKKRHVVDSGIGKNWFIERLNREIKRRIKWFSTFQSLEGAHAFFGLWFYHHNLNTS